MTNTADTIVPCGACRQFMSELCNNQMLVYTVGNNNKISQYYKIMIKIKLINKGHNFLTDTGGPTSFVDIKKRLNLS